MLLFIVTWVQIRVLLADNECRGINCGCKAPMYLKTLIDLKDSRFIHAKKGIIFWFVLLMTIIFFSGCMTQVDNPPISPSAPQIMNVHLPIATPTRQIVYVTVIVPVSASTFVETVCNGSEHSNTNIRMIGNVYGLASASAEGIDEIKFTIGLAPCSSAIDLTTLQIVFSTPNAPNVTLTQSTRTSTSFFTTKIGTTKVTSLNPGDQAEVTFFVTPVSANTKMNIELKPSVGAVLPFSKTAPATIAATNVLYSF
jgi:archaellin